MDEEEIQRVPRDEFEELDRDLQDLSKRVFVRDHLRRTIFDYMFMMGDYFLTTGGPVTRFPSMRRRYDVIEFFVGDTKRYSEFFVVCRCYSAVAWLTRTPLEVLFRFRITIKVTLPIGERTPPLVIRKVMTTALVLQIPHDESETDFNDAVRALIEDPRYPGDGIDFPLHEET